MRRKVIQHFVNMFPQRFLDLPSGFDLAVFAKHAQGVAHFDFLSATATIDGLPCSQLRTATDFHEWFVRELNAHHVPVEGISCASMDVFFTVTNNTVKTSFGHASRAADFSFEFVSIISTDETTYRCSSSGSKLWEYGYYWEQLYPTAP